jgi:hypothetical protein
MIVPALISFTGQPFPFERSRSDLSQLGFLATYCFSIFLICLAAPTALFILLAAEGFLSADPSSWNTGATLVSH